MVWFCPVVVWYGVWMDMVFGKVGFRWRLRYMLLMVVVLRSCEHISVVVVVWVPVVMMVSQRVLGCRQSMIVIRIQSFLLVIVVVVLFVWVSGSGGGGVG